MGYYDEDYDFYYNEPSEFDEKCQDLIDLLRKNATEKIKNELAAKDAEIERLKELNAKMQDVFDNYESKKREYEWNETTLRENIKREIRKERLTTLLEDFYSDLYIVVNNGKEQPKCDKCDEEGYIHYKTPLGKDALERCSCRERVPYYTVAETNLVSFNLNFAKTAIIGYFRRCDILDYGYFESEEYASDMLYSGQPFETLDEKMTYFKDKDKAQEYADWLNSKESNNGL